MGTVINNLHENLKSLGEGKTIYQTSYNPDLLETFPNPEITSPYVIDIEAPEFTCLCPKTGQPDFGKIIIAYRPRAKCLESKSLKLYLGSFRQEGVFHEAVTNKIADDLFKLLDPFWLEVTGEFNPRGGITFHPTVFRGKKG